MPAEPARAPERGTRDAAGWRGRPSAAALLHRNIHRPSAAAGAPYPRPDAIPHAGIAVTDPQKGVMHANGWCPGNAFAHQ